MPYNKFTYADLTAQINVLSHLAANLHETTGGDQPTKYARTLIGSRIRTEIDRLNRHRKKMKIHSEKENSETPSSIELE